MNKQEIEKAIETLKDMKGVFDTRSHKQYSLPALGLAISALEHQLTNGWIPVSERLPEDDNPVLVTARYKEGVRGYFIYRACYVAPKTRTTEDYGWDRDNIDTEYDEEHDCYWIPECWYEDNAVEDNGNWILDDDYEILAWRNLPDPYKELATDNKVTRISRKSCSLNICKSIQEVIREGGSRLLEINKIYQGDVLKVLKTFPDESIHCCVTSPPYWGLRDYGVEGQLGLESTPEEYVTKMVEVFREVKRVLRKDGTLWLNLGDSYCGTGNKGEYKDPKYLDGRNGQKVALNNKIKGLKSKDLVGIPWMVAFALRADGWYLRQDIIWHKPNPMPESVKDRCTKAHEYIFLLSKNRKYYYDNEAIREPYQSKKEKPRNKAAEGYNNSYVGGRWSEGVRDYYAAGKRNKRSVWTVTTKPFKGAHFAVFPEDLIEPCILAGCPEGGIVLDPFMGSGTTAVVALKHNRNYIGIELNPEYIKIAEKRISDITPEPKKN